MINVVVSIVVVSSLSLFFAVVVGQDTTEQVRSVWAEIARTNVRVKIAQQVPAAASAASTRHWRGETLLLLLFPSVLFIFDDP